MKYWNIAMKICKKSKHKITRQDLKTVETAVKLFNTHWNKVKDNCETYDTYSFGAKFHYFLNHFEEYMKFWLITLGYGSEQSFESYHKVCNPIIE